MERKSRRVLTGLAATGVLAGAAVWGGVAYADSGNAQPAAVTTTAQTASTGTSATDHRGGIRFLRRHHGARLVFRTAAEYLGLSREELHTQLHEGKSLAAVATAQNKSVSGLENAILAAVAKRVDASKLTATRKAEVISAVQQNLNAFVTVSHPFRWADHRLGKAAGTGTDSDSVTQSALTALTE
jgi:hypothetical protein